MGLKIVVVLSLLSIYRFLITVDGQFTPVAKYCNYTSSNYSEGSVFDKNLGLFFSSLTAKTSQLFYNNSVGDGSDRVYGLFQCRFDVGFDVCHTCVKDATQLIGEECPLGKESLIWYKECMLRYSDRNIFSLYDNTTQPGWYVKSNVNETDSAEFGLVLKNEMNGLIQNASYSPRRFASRIFNWSVVSEQLFSFAQCTPDINPSDCTNCLALAYRIMTEYCPASAHVVVYYPSCQLWYNRSKPILNDEPVSSLVPSPADDQIASDVGSIGEEDVVHYDFATLKAVTGDFAAENKLGEGGFGSVYKGTLEDGKILAIKRLSDSSGQGTKEFMAEARFLAKLQHKNLVRLIGYCSEGEEKLLVYEFLSNSSLDGFLFDREKHPILDWATRYNTIVGIARGLQYLHEDSRFTIIHRDLKPENILMDDNMNPRIADFGLARLFERTQNFRNTIRIAGTRGYMSPECLLGEYSSKTDIYSFGVMILEIVTGHRMFKRNSQDDLLMNAWRLWNEQRAIELVDPELDKSYSSKDIERCIQIGLLCVQPDAEQRPTMTNVVLMLTVDLIDLPLPSPPMMSFPQFNIPRLKTGEEHSDSDQFSSKSVTADLNTNPR
ncbi:cysteine-rich receptor-like protein kinase 25 [Silene latifolia]|uniref:cysteine-rich receptor-like protein kinase 25 n=1 Tax=Silene latifolia TaxID=37657 RepID=UPI003D76EEB1